MNKTYPILLSTPMVQATLAGRKTQTRRIMKHQPPLDCGPIYVEPYHPTVVVRGEEQPGSEIFGAFNEDGDWGCKCPYGPPGSHLWVKETWCQTGLSDGIPIAAYRAGGSKYIGKHEKDGHDFLIGDVPETPENEPVVRGWRPSIFMPRWASRITLEITNVRVERLHEVSQQDAIAEGVQHTLDGAWHIEDDMHRATDPRDTYASLWESINGSGSWDANPWVWVVEFKKVTV